MTFLNGSLHDQNKWTYIDNTNLDYTCLNRGGLHLNRNGILTLLLEIIVITLVVNDIGHGQLL
jgi:hypothetical protein